ncbi:MAG TPA: ABC transporter substrate-binding protein [Nocardioidaceae bacterium]|nr:ABC transporter substrate-binding protein [Nocardioidaceae bacterium]
MIGAFAALALLVTGCSSGGDTASGDSSGPAAAGTVTVGFVSPVTGFAAALGTDMKRGWDLYWELNGATAGGATVKTVYEDDAGDPEVALTKARRLVEQENVDMVAGPILANTAYAVASYVAGKGLPTLQITGADDLTQRQYDPHILRVGYTSSQSNFPAGEWAYKQGHRKAVTLCPDYAFGWESCGGFVSAFTAAGGEVVAQVWNPLGTQDFSTYVSQIKQLNPDVVFVGSAGGPDAILLHKAWTSFGLEKTPIIGNCCFADEVFLREIGDAAVGINSLTYWSAGRDSETVKAFVAEYEKRYDEIPSLYAAGSYMMAEVTAKTLESTKGTVDGEKFIESARALTFEDSLYGPVKFDDHNNIVGPVYVTEVQKRDGGGYWNVPTETIDDVSQFWNLSPEDYMKAPVFSRDHTGNEG